MTTVKKTRVVSPEERFGVLMCDLLDAIKDEVKRIAPKTSFANLKIARSFVKKLDDQMLVLEFLKHSPPQWELIRTAHTTPRNNLPTDGIRIGGKQTSKMLKSYVSVLLNTDSSQLTDFWEILQSLIRCSIHFLYENPKHTPKDLEPIEKLAQRWQIKLGTVVETAESSDESDEREDASDREESDEEDDSESS